MPGAWRSLRPHVLLTRRLQSVARRCGGVPVNVLRLLRFASARLVARIPTDCITDEYGFSFGARGWHYFRALIAEHERRPDAPLEETTYYRFFQHERVRSIRYLDDLLFLHCPVRQEARFRFYFGTYPWGGWTRTDSAAGGMPWGHHYDRQEGQTTRDLYGYRRNPWYQPGDPHPLRIEWADPIRLHHAIKRGYRPLLHGAAYPSIVLLVRADGAVRAVRYDGNHRLSVLAHLGHDPITVWIDRATIQHVREADVDRWYYVARGLCSRQRALEIFAAFFELTGRERITSLGLPSIY